MERQPPTRAERSRRATGECALCARLVPLTFHHLIPRKVHRRPRFRKAYSREQLNCGIDICRDCHKGLHRLYDEMTLALELNSLAALRADTAVARHVGWVARQRRAAAR